MIAEARLICAHVLDGLRTLPDESVHCVVTSPMKAVARGETTWFFDFYREGDKREGDLRRPARRPGQREDRHGAPQPAPEPAPALPRPVGHGRVQQRAAGKARAHRPAGEGEARKVEARAAKRATAAAMRHKNPRAPVGRPVGGRNGHSGNSQGTEAGV